MSWEVPVGQMTAARMPGPSEQRVRENEVAGHLDSGDFDL